MAKESALPELKPELSDFERAIFRFVLESWPVSSLEIAEHFGEVCESREERKKLSTRYTYYLKKLVSKQVLVSKRIGNALVVWPLQAEKLRTIHHILREDYEEGEI